MAWEVRADNGIALPQIGWWLDAAGGVPRALVTHAHSDHIGRHRETICTKPTALFLEARLGRRPGLQVRGFGAEFPLTLDCTATLLPAGHIRGSAQVLLRHKEHGTLLYTGDFRLRGGRGAEPCATPAADVLIMESTFGLPRYVMPPTPEVEAAILEFCRAALAEGVTPVLFAYALGKSQELLHLLGECGLPAMVPPDTFRLTRLHEQVGDRFGSVAEFDPRACAGTVVVCPPQFPGLNYVHPRRTAAVTGWAIDSSTRYQYGCDAAFPLSDHSDFTELRRFVELVRPKVVYTVHGFSREFAATLRASGVEAWALGHANQTEFALEDA